MDPLLQRALEIANRPRSPERPGDAVSEAIIVEPAHPQTRPVYFERNDGVIYGPATVTDLAKTGTGTTEQFWVIVEFQGLWEWVVSDRLRSKQAFESQPTVRTVELVQEPK